MEVLKLDIIGTYHYNPDIQISSYVKKSKQNEKWSRECVICKRLLCEPSYDTISNNSSIIDDVEIVIGKCGHMFHGDCLDKWLKNCDICPIDKVKWCLHRIADTTTKLVICQNTKRIRKCKAEKLNLELDKKKAYNNTR